MHPTHPRPAACALMVALVAAVIIAVPALAPGSRAPALEAVRVVEVAAPPHDDPAGAGERLEPEPRRAIAIESAPEQRAKTPGPLVDPSVLDEVPTDAKLIEPPAEQAAAPQPIVEVALAAPAAPPLEPQAERKTTSTAELATTGPGDPIEVEITVSALPDPPDVAASHASTTVAIDRPSDPWQAVRRCESSGNYGINTGNGFYGAYQFTISTWDWVAGIIGRDDLVGVRPDQATPIDQDMMADSLAFRVRGGGLHHWPVCGRHYGA